MTKKDSQVSLLHRMICPPTILYIFGGAHFVKVDDILFDSGLLVVHLGSGVDETICEVTISSEILIDYHCVFAKKNFETIAKIPQIFTFSQCSKGSFNTGFDAHATACEKSQFAGVG